MHSPANDQAIAIVAGQAITRHDYEVALEKQAGKTVLNKLVYTVLVRQAAAEANVLPTDSEVEARIADLSRRNTQIMAQAHNPATRQDFREDLRTDIALENLRIQNITAFEDEINAFYANNKASFTLPGQAQTTVVVTHSKSDANVAESLIRQDMSPDEIASHPGLHVAGLNGFSVNWNNLPSAFREEVGKTTLAMKPGQIKTFPVNASCLTIKVKSVQDAITPPLTQIREQVARQVKLAKAVSPQQELAQLYADNLPTFSDPKYEAYFNDLNNAPGAR